MSTLPSLTQIRADQLSNAFLLVAVNPRATLSSQAVAAAIGCTQDQVRAFIDEGVLPASVESDGKPGERLQIPRSYVIKLLFLMAGEAPEAFVARATTFLPLLNPEHLEAAMAAVKDLLNEYLS